MSPADLLQHIAPEHLRRVEELLARVPGGLADQATLDAFAQKLHEAGLLSTDGWRAFSTLRALRVDPSPDAPVLARDAPRYRALARIAAGGMGEVHLSKEAGLDRTVAVKRVHAHLQRSDAVLRRFLTEAQVTAQLDHPAIVPVYGLEREPDGSYSYAMKLVRGETLGAFIAEAARQVDAHGRPRATHALKARLEVILPVLNAVAYAHRRGVVHRDLKPDNIMVGSFGEVLVMDWGVAGFFEPAPDEPSATSREGDAPVGAREAMRSEARRPGPGMTVAGAVIGTPEFMSPEQAFGESLDGASDQFALGLILQELVTLEPARAARSYDGALALARTGERRPALPRRAASASGRTLAPEPIARELVAIIDKATAYDKARRYPSVEALTDDVRRFLRDESVEADPDTGLRRAQRWVGRHRGLVLALGVGLLMLVVSVAAVVLWRAEVELAAQRALATARENAVMNLAALVDAQARDMTAELHGYELALAEIATSARLLLTRPAPPSRVVVYRYRDGAREPEAVTVPTQDSAVYRQPASLAHADYALAHGVDEAPLRAHVDRVAQLEPVLRRALLESAGTELLGLPPARVEHRVLQLGVPIAWAYFGSTQGVSIGLPGTWDYEDSEGGIGYDHRRESWYRETLPRHGPVWSSDFDENGLGLLLTVAQTVRDDDGRALGVAALDLAMRSFVERLLTPPSGLVDGGEALLLDADGRVLVRSRDGLAAVTPQGTGPAAPGAPTSAPHAIEDAALLDAIGRADVGHASLPGRRLALWSAVGRAGLVYVMIGPERTLLDSASAP